MLTSDLDFLRLLISEGAISRKTDAAADPSGDEGMGPVNNAGAFAPVMTAVLDDNGQPTGATTPLIIACRIAQQSARARNRVDGKEGKDTDVTTLTLFTEYRTDVLERDRITVEGLLYDIGPVNDPGLMHHHLEFTVKKVS